VDAVTAAALEARELNIGDLNISTPEYRRVGHAIATLVVKAAAPGCVDPALIHARMRVQRPAGSIVLDPALVTHEAPGRPRQELRIWFLVDVSLLIFGDATFALLVGDAELPLRDPQLRGPWMGGEGDEDVAIDSAWSESELGAVVAALEQRCRVAERSAAALRELLERESSPGDNLAELTRAWREVEVLQELLDKRESAYRALKDVLDAAASERDARDAEIKVMQADGRRLAEAVAATLGQVQDERQVLLDQAADAVNALGLARAAASAPPPRRPRRGLLGRTRLVRT
jgi:hypothetical protein